MMRRVVQSIPTSILLAASLGCGAKAEVASEDLCGNPSFETFLLATGGGWSAAADDRGNFWFPEVDRFDPLDLTATPKRLADAIARVAFDGTLAEFEVNAPLAGGIAVDSNGDVRFTMSTGPALAGMSSLGRLTSSGQLTIVPLSRQACSKPPCSEPQYDVMSRAMTGGPDGNAWFAEGNSVLAPQGRITRVDRSNEALDQFLIESPAVSDMVAGPDGNLWVMGDRWQDKGPYIARLTPSGEVSAFLLNNPVETGRMAFGPDGNLWYTYASTGVSQHELFLGRMNLQGQISTTIRLPYDNRRPHPIAVGRDGKLWIGGADKLICATVDGQIGTVPVPVPDSPRPDIPRPLICFQAMVHGSDGHLWLLASPDCYFVSRVVRVDVD